jgi:hypothetical protein
MNNDVSVSVTTENYKSVIDEIESAFFDIPFENSEFQTNAFVVASQITPARAYRAIGLRMHSKLRALEEAKFGRMKEDIDIEELQEKIQDPNTSKWDRMRAEVDIQQKISSRRFTDKLINDALAELNVLYSHFKVLPKYTRSQFEQEEQFHFTQRLNRQLQGVQGASESLTNMSLDTQLISSFETNYMQSLVNSQPQSLESLLQDTINDVQQQLDPQPMKITTQFSRV